jgi:hypothetical protein
MGALQGTYTLEDFLCCRQPHFCLLFFFFFFFFFLIIKAHAMLQQVVPPLVYACAPIMHEGYPIFRANRHVTCMLCLLHSLCLTSICAEPALALPFSTALPPLAKAYPAPLAFYAL